MIPTATTSASGLMSAAIFNQHVTNTAKVSNATHTGDVTDASGVLTVNKINGVSMAGLATGIVKNTTSTGAPSIAVAADFPTLNQNTTGTAAIATNITGGGAGTIPYQTASSTTAMLAAGTSGYVLKSNGSAAPSWAPVDLASGLSGSLPVSSGGTGAVTLTGIVKGNGTSAFTTVTAPAGDIVGTTDTQTLTNKTLGSGTTIGVLGTPSSGTLTSCTGLPIDAGTSGTLPVTRGGSGAVTLTGILKGNGTSAFTVITAPTGDIVGTTDTQTLTNKTFGSGTTINAIGTPTTGTLTNCTGLPISAGTTGTLPVNRGGTGAAILSGILVGNGTNAFTTLTAPAGAIVGTTDIQTLTNKTIGSGTTVTTLGTPESGTLTNCTGLPLTTGVTGSLPATSGGTGQISYAVGDILFASTSTALSKLAGVATGNVLISGGVTTAPSYGKVGLTTHVSGTLPVLNGGTGVTTSTGSGASVLATTPTLVTPILGTPTSGTLTSCTGLPLTTGVTGTLPVANGGTGVTQSVYGECYISSIVATTIASIGVFVKVAGTTTAGVLSNFTHPVSNRLTYTGTAPRKFLVTAALSFHGTNTNDYKFAFYENGSTLLTSSTISATGTGAGNLSHISCQCIVDLATNDYIEVFVTNTDAANNATIDFMNVTAVALI